MIRIDRKRGIPSDRSVLRGTGKRGMDSFSRRVLTCRGEEVVYQFSTRPGTDCPMEGRAEPRSTDPAED